MYTLYYSPGACSLATQVVLHQLAQPVNIIDKQNVADFNAINPTGSVPVLQAGQNTLTEGAAIMLHLLDKHQNSLLPASGQARQKAIQDIMFANATMHPAYSKLFFLAQQLNDENAKQQGLNSAAQTINRLWQIVESELANQAFLGGDAPSAADIMLSVYSAWGDYFAVDIIFGERTQTMLQAVKAMPSFERAVAAEQAASA